MRRASFHDRREEDLPVLRIKEEAPELDEDHVELIWGGSAALLIYQMGIAHAICRNYKRQHLLKRLKVAGLSGGSATAGYMIATMYGVGDMEYWYRQHVRKVVQLSSFEWSIRGWSNIIWSLGYEYYRVCHTLGLREDDWSSRYRVIASTLFGKIHLLTEFPNASSFGDAICSSSLIPFVSSPDLGFVCRDVNSGRATTLVDGGFAFSLRKYNPNYKCVHFSLYHRTEHERTSKTNHRQLHFPIVGERRFLLDNLRMIFSVDYADKMFVDGITWGEKHLRDIERVLEL